MAINSVTIQLPSGLFEIEYTDRLEEQVRARWGIAPEQPVDITLIKAFIEQELRSALAKEIENV